MRKLFIRTFILSSFFFLRCRQTSFSFSKEKKNCSPTGQPTRATFLARYFCVEARITGTFRKYCRHGRHTRAERKRPSPALLSCAGQVISRAGGKETSTRIGGMLRSAPSGYAGSRQRKPDPSSAELLRCCALTRDSALRSRGEYFFSRASEREGGLFFWSKKQGMRRLVAPRSGAKSYRNCPCVHIEIHKGNLRVFQTSWQPWLLQSSKLNTILAPLAPERVLRGLVRRLS